MNNIVICEPLRSPIGRFSGQFRDLRVQQLGSQVLKEFVRRTGIAPSDVDDVILGNCYPTMDSPALGRVVALDAGLPIETPGYQIDRRCGSGLQAVLNAAMQVATGASDLIIAGGAESMSNAAFYSTEMRWGVKGPSMPLHDSLARGRVTAGGANYPVPGGMLETAENLRRDYSITREEQDRLAFESHRRAVAAQQSGAFDDEIVPIEVRGRKGALTVVDTDEHPRPDISLDTLAALSPLLLHSDPAATVTAGNASGQNDGAALCIVTTGQEAERLGLRPLVRLVSWAIAGVPPKTMGIGPVPATSLALERARLTLADIDLIELNEAFASQVLACTREWGFGEADFERTNIHGSGISLGHPLGATGVRTLSHIAREMQRREARYGLETMCIGGGQGIAAIFGRVA